MNRRNLVIGAVVLLVLCIILGALGTIFGTDEPEDQDTSTSTLETLDDPTEEPEPTKTVEPTEQSPEPTGTPEPTSTPRPTDTADPPEEPTDAPESLGTAGGWEDGSIDNEIAGLDFKTTYVGYNPDDQILVITYRNAARGSVDCSAPYENDHSDVLTSVNYLLEEGYPQFERVTIQQVDDENYVVSQLLWVPADDLFVYSGPETMVAQCQ